MKRFLALSLSVILIFSLMSGLGVALEPPVGILPSVPPPIPVPPIGPPPDFDPEPFEQRSSVLVSPPHHDDVGVILRQLLIPHDQLAFQNSHLMNDLEFISQYDIVFLNCGINAHPDVIRAFVEQGGLVYASDLTLGRIIAPAFPEMRFTYGSHSGTVAANILDEGLRVQLGGRNVVNVAIPGGGNLITGWAENAELKIYMDFVHSVRGNIPLIAAFEHGEGRVIFTGFHHHVGQTPSDMRRILSHLAFGLYLEDEITAITEFANERGFSTLHPIFGNRPPALDDAGNVIVGEAALGAWAAGGGGAWEGDVAAAPPPAAAGMPLFDGGYVEFENFIHAAIEGETFAIIVAAELGDFLVHLTSPDGYTYTNETEGIFVGAPPVFTPQAFSGSIEDLGDEMTVISLGADGLIVVNPIAGNWEFAMETEDERADMFAAGLALGFGGNFNIVPDPNRITVLLDGTPLEFDVAPIKMNNRVMVPVRAIAEALGAEVEWDGDTQNVTVELTIVHETTTTFQIGSYTMQIAVRYLWIGMPDDMPRPSVYSSWGEVELDVAPFIINGRTLVPLRAISEAFGADVDWCGDTRTVIIETTE